VIGLRTHGEERFAEGTGTWIRETRLSLKLSHEALAKACGVHRNTIWHWERGDSIPNAYKLDLLKRFLKNAAVSL
jgi:transcriptional regulator with XRE-family HTH domain